MARRKPHDPAAAARIAEERREREAETARLQAMGATITTDPVGRIVSARRSNVFTLLLARNTITPNHHDAAYTLANTWAAWKGLDGKPEARGEAVDGGSGCPELVTDRMIRAGKDVARTLDQLSPQAQRIISAFMVATVEEDRPMAWRGVVQRETGETVRERQTALVVAACEELRVVYQEPRRAAA